MKANAAVGFYGKLPLLGDFVSRHLPLEFITAWDKWLQNAIFTSREQLGPIWLDRYLTSPIWRFVLSSGLCGNTAWAGILMPSVDKVGRYFPFTVAVTFQQSTHLADLFILADDWFKQIESAALSGLEGDMNLSSFEQFLQNIPIFSFSEQEQMSEEFVGLNSYLSQLNSGYSLWSSSDSEEMQIKKLLVYRNLPPSTAFSGFLTGNIVNMALESDAVFVSNNASSNLDCKSFTKPWQSWAVTDTGKRRKRNEDAILNRPEAGLWVVADGMGGHDAGDVASQLIVNTLQTLFPVAVLENTVDEVKHCLQNVNDQLRTLAKQKPGHRIIGSTVVVLLAEPERCAFLWAGDSRLYRLRTKKLQQLTQDHCPEHDYLNADLWSVKSANEITRAVGADDELELDFEISDICDGDIFLLCSDGLDKEVSHKEIEQIMKSHQPENIAEVLLELTLQRGARDNVSILVVAITNGLVAK